MRFFLFSASSLLLIPYQKFLYLLIPSFLSFRYLFPSFVHPAVLLRCVFPAPINPFLPYLHLSSFAPLPSTFHFCSIFNHFLFFPLSLLRAMCYLTHCFLITCFIFLLIPSFRSLPWSLITCIYFLRVHSAGKLNNTGRKFTSPLATREAKA